MKWRLKYVTVGLCCVCLVGLLTYQFYLKPKYVDKLVAQADNIIALLEQGSDVSGESVTLAPDEQQDDEGLGEELSAEEQQTPNFESQATEDTANTPAVGSEVSEAEASSVAESDTEPVSQIRQVEPEETSIVDSDLEATSKLEQGGENIQPVIAAEEEVAAAIMDEEKSTESVGTAVEEATDDTALSEEEKAGDEEEVELPLEATFALGDKSIAELREQVDKEDQIKGLKLAVKLDIGYLMSFASGGVDAEEAEAIKAHLHEKLSDEEYQQLKELVLKYLYLIQ